MDVSIDLPDPAAEFKAYVLFLSNHPKGSPGAFRSQVIEGSVFKMKVGGSPKVPLRENRCCDGQRQNGQGGMRQGQDGQGQDVSELGCVMIRRSSPVG